MAEIKRPNYFTSQFLVEKDFNDEQAYHLGMRRRLNRVLQTSGVADGLVVTRTSANQVQISPGTAVDRDGREIVLQDARTHTLATVGNNLDVYLTIAYDEFLDPIDQYPQAGPDKFIRTTERPALQDGSATPPADGSVVLLARIRLNGQGAIDSDGSIDNTVRTLVGSRIAPQSIGTPQLADGGVTLSKLAPAVRPIVSVDGVSNPGGNIDLQAQNAITLSSDNTAKRITIGESHSALTNNPHATTAAQVGALALQNYSFTHCQFATVAFTNLDGSGATRTVNTVVPGTSTPFQAKFIWVIGSYSTGLSIRQYGGTAPGFADLRGSIRQSGTSAVIEIDQTIGLVRNTVTVSESSLCDVFFQTTNGRESRVFVNINAASATAVTFFLGRIESSTLAPIAAFEMRLRVMIFG
jgi:hypothetical protein